MHKYLIVRIEEPETTEGKTKTAVIRRAIHNEAISRDIKLSDVVMDSEKFGFSEGLQERVHKEFTSLLSIQKIKAKLTTSGDPMLRDFKCGDKVIVNHSYYGVVQGEVIQVLADRTIYDAPYRVALPELSGKPRTDWFPSDELTLLL